MDLLISNAGIMLGRPHGGVLESAVVARSVLQTNVLAAIDAVHLALPGMQRRVGAGVRLDSEPISTISETTPL